MKKTKTVILSVALTFVILLPFVLVPLLGALLPPVYTNSFVNALGEKTERLYSIKEPKIVIIGGSSAAFGIDSEIIERYTGMPVVNYGLYAALGTKLMLDMSKDAIGEDDIIIVAPEMDAQTLSLYFSSATTLRALDGSPSLFKHVDTEHVFTMLGASWSFTAEKIRYLNGEIPNPDGVYNSKNFNERGDLVWEREENIMNLYYDPNTPINLDKTIVSEDFVDYLNDYIALAERKGATVCFSYPPMNEMALTDTSDAKAFEDYLKSRINAGFISNLSDYIYEAGYFYDTNFHLNEAGVRRHTVNLTKDILLELGIPTLVKEEVPEAPALPEADVRFFGEDDNAKYFEYEKRPDGSYMIVGVKTEWKSETSLTVPLGYGGYKVSAIASGAFEGSLVARLTLTEDTNIRHIMNGAFVGASSLTELWIYYKTQSDIMPPADFSGVAVGFKVYVPSDSDYPMGYYWSERGLTFVRITE